MLSVVWGTDAAGAGTDESGWPLGGVILFFVDDAHSSEIAVRTEDLRNA